jgi:manganese/zinc/iron transport system permease protein
MSILFPTINSFYVFAGSILLGGTAGLLGVYAVLRRHGLLADALSHAALPGIALAFIIMEVKYLPGLLFGALIFGLLGAWCTHFLTTHTKIRTDAAMASVLSVFFGFGVVLLTYIQKLPLASQAGLETFLFGQAASLLLSDTLLIGVVFLLVLLFTLFFWKELKIFVFDPDFTRVIGFRYGLIELLFMTLFVISILVSLQAVGVILTAAMFVIPAVASLLWSSRLSTVVILSLITGIISGGSSAIISSHFDKLPTGPLMVLVATLFFLVGFFFAPRVGLFHRFMVHRKLSLKIQRENILARLYRASEKGMSTVSADELLELGRAHILRSLVSDAFIKKHDESYMLTARGKLAGSSVIERHRLWELYLAQKLHLPLDHVHDDAETMEHILTDDLVKELRKLFNDPHSDPHGHPIPRT